MSTQNLTYPTEGSVKVNALGETQLFKSMKVGSNTLLNRVVFAPTTRYRAGDNHTPSDLQLHYYDQRTRSPGSLVITEATHISAESGLYEDAPGIWNDKQTAAWKKITDKVHENKSFISSQLWTLGRVTEPEYFKKAGYTEVLAPSAIFPSEEFEVRYRETGVQLRALTVDEIQDLIKKDYTIAAQNALAAGFDYVEIHAAHGYLVDTFLQPSSNQRTDQYGGSVENRARFVLELVDHLTKVVGADKLAIRLSPWAAFGGVKGADEEVSPYVTFGYLVEELQKRADQGNELAYVSLIEPRVAGSSDVNEDEQRGDNTFITDAWKGTVVRAGNFSYDAPRFTDLQEKISDGRTLVAFARYYVSNPDLVERLRHGHPLVPYHRAVFYNNTENWGYGTYTAYNEKKEYDQETERKRTSKPLA